ncbi:DUF421 domain-containing protein [Spirosoma utsteinense]|uniref:Membrane protein YcaP (DUF421 family) n=1 Tax=Spirosoma utsteinense TaxID=2585773 RepID=A0ABR6W7R9_9BACT|nr:DUF421 domain-containing protein [Spirosoma utsteinense]MBC3787886.1 putative membrane protein YcaP (DUF421 family) [Spirosoma utsteinense]MBC3792193.1 putative membrane protein YcaP (DUF421 family) [Spirosoma utsteinense]
MKKEDIHLFDWLRILVGEVPASFYVEIIIRAAFVYLLLVVSMRLMGRRMATQLSRNEMAAMVSMAAAIGVPILDASRGLLPAVMIAIVVVSTQRLVSYLASRNQTFEGISQDISVMLVEDAVMHLPVMKGSGITRQLLFAQLRSNGLTHLGYVKRLYMEANGSFTLITDPDPKPGLSLLPEWDADFLNEQEKAPGQLVCYHCGNPQPETNRNQSCTRCDRKEWVEALR